LEVTEATEAAEVVSRVDRGTCDLLAVAAVPGLNHSGVALARTVKRNRWGRNRWGQAFALWLAYKQLRNGHLHGTVATDRR
jgi:hypothetical protein